MVSITLTPAYGRDYDSAEEAKQDFFANKDFILNDIFDPWNGRPINKSQITTVTTEVRIRYKNLTRVTVISLNKKS